MDGVKVPGIGGKEIVINYSKGTRGIFTSKGIIRKQKDLLQTKKFKSKFEWETYSNMAFYKIFSDYFNVVSQDKKFMKENKIRDLRFFRNKSYLDTIDLVRWWDETSVMFKYDNLEVCFSFDKYKSNNEIMYTLILTSKESTYLEAPYFYKEILKSALSISNLRGSYIEMVRDKFWWNKKELEKRDFRDIALPKNSLEDLKLFINIFIKKNKMLRYLMVGNPGTGKTESTLIIANELNKQGVTIIKTPVCGLLKEKIELAEILAPSIIIFDDLDLSIGSRAKGGYSPKELQIFLDAMDGIDKISKGVGIIATSNSAHLLDLAAQRPGRFDKILIFDNLTKRNIGDIILKSLKYNFDIIRSNGDKKIIDLFYNKEIVSRFGEAKVTGAHIFNSIKMLKLKADMLYENYDLDWILAELTNEIEMVDKMRKSNHISDRLSKGGGGSIGFGNNFKTEDDINWNDEEDWSIDSLDECEEEKGENSSSVRRNNSR